MLVTKTLHYHSRADGAGPLYADYCYRDDGKAKPLLLVMHGYSGNRTAVAADIRALAQHGVVAVAPDMRGGGESAGRWDSGGLDVYDAVDAMFAVHAEIPAQVDAGKWHIVGYSGGGGNAISAGCRFPDLFRTAVSFFGIADYAGFYTGMGRPDCNAIMRQAIGAPEEFPARFEARNMTPAAGNARGTRWWFFWDAEESQCPPNRCVEPWCAAYRASGGTHLQVSVSQPTDAIRWLHGYRTDHPLLANADALFLADVLRQPAAGELALPDEGALVVPGYLVTRHFRVMLGDGQEGTATIRYRLQPEPVVEVIDNPRRLPVRIELY